MRISVLLASLGLAASVAVSVHAQDMDKLKADLKQKMPDLPIDSVRKIPYGPLVEVVVGGEILYTDEKLTFLLGGPLLDLKTKENVTDARLRQVNAIKFEQLPLGDAIKIVRGNGSRKVAIFEDPNCGYCKRFERDLQGVTDITVYVFLYPILAADSAEKSKRVWCAPDKGKAWLDTMLRESIPTGDASCTTPIDKNLAFGQSKRINGTPTIIFENGERTPGAMQIGEFEKRLVAAKVASSK